MTKRSQKINDEMAAIESIQRMGPMREPEIAAYTGLDEDRVYRACKALQTRGFMARREDGELSLVD